ncbi:hypothetical protein R1X32_11070 (plasmid) [Rhodococcus opacus]|uniref:hypothetical protein n=1 Tax=Rhodococcus opacus TaxID=37919 RepID=UPI0034D21CFF
MTVAISREADAARRSDSAPRVRKHCSRLPHASIIMGALSIASFWVFGLGFALGLSAVACGILATSRSDIAEDEAASLWALLGVVAGIGGIIASTISLVPLFVHM